MDLQLQLVTIIGHLEGQQQLHVFGSSFETIPLEWGLVLRDSTWGKMAWTSEAWIEPWKIQYSVRIRITYNTALYDIQFAAKFGRLCYVNLGVNKSCLDDIIRVRVL